MGFGLFRRRKGKTKVLDVEAQWPSSPAAYYSSYSPHRASIPLSSYFYSNYGESSESRRYGEGSSHHGASTDHDPYSHYEGGYSNHDYNNPIIEYNYSHPPPSAYYAHAPPLSPPRSSYYYIPAPQPSPLTKEQPQEPWLPELYVPPSPMYYEMEPPQPPPPFPPSYHFFEPPPQRSSVHPSSEDELNDCMIM